MNSNSSLVNQRGNQIISNFPTISETNSNGISSKNEDLNKKNKNEKSTKISKCFFCSVEDCNKLFTIEEELKKHKLEHKIIYYCSYDRCDKSFTNLINLKKHYKIHFPSQKIYYCPFPGCKKSFTALNNLTIHYRLHTGNKPYACEICGMRFFNRANYKYHKSVKHKNINEKETICHHEGCHRKSKTAKQKLMHHDKLEPECKSEKNHLVELLIQFEKSVGNFIGNINNYILINNDNNDDNANINNNDNKIFNQRKIEEGLFREEIINIMGQSKIFFNVSIDKEQFQGIAGKY